MRKTTGRSINEIVASFSTVRQTHIQEGADKLIQEYKSLQEFRKTIGWTQEELAEKMELKQANISQLEKREDMHLSTLRRYVVAMGCELEINIKVPDSSVRVS
ncbi:MAG: DNA-binding XRE family transcriptional regulator [Saprospiraceae bacterium]|jgi:DNA-binding XRE family transcriptional regulator